MTTPLSWSARVLNAQGNAAAGASLVVEVFDLYGNKWVAVSQATTGVDGKAKGRGKIGDDTLPFAPALRLVEGEAVMSATPAITRAGRGVTVDFGEVRRAVNATPFLRTVGRGLSPFVVGGGPAAAVDMAALRADIGRDFADRLTVRDRDVADRDLRLVDNVRLVGEKDSELRRLATLLSAKEQEITTLLSAQAQESATLLSAKDQEIAALRQLRPVPAAIDAVAIKAEVTRNFSNLLAARDRDVIDRDGQIALRDATLTESIRNIEGKDAEIREVTNRLAARDRDLADRDLRLADTVRVVGDKDSELRRLATMLSAKDQEIATLRQPRADGRPVDVAAIRAEVTRDFSDLLAAKDRDVVDRDSQIAVREARIADNSRKIEGKEAEISLLNGVIERKDREIADIRRPAVGVTGVTDFAATIGVQLDDAQRALKTRGFSLGSIEVNAKALIRDQGRKLEMPDQEMMKTVSPDALSDLRFSFRPDKPAPEVTGQTVPDLMFLTESRARGVLTSLGLSLESSTGPASLNAQASFGQAMLQTPAPSTPLPRGGRVHVIFAAEKE